MEKEKTNEKSQGLSKVLGPMHIWALGVGIVLVGEFMGWNFTVAKGGSIGSVIALWTVAMLYVMIVMMNTEMGSVMPEAGGQYTICLLYTSNTKIQRLPLQMLKKHGRVHWRAYLLQIPKQRDRTRRLTQVFLIQKKYISANTRSPVSYTHLDVYKRQESDR